MSERIFTGIGENQTGEVANYLAGLSQQFHTITFTGDLGAGKTTLVQQLVRQLGSVDAASSPTFSLVNEYLTADGRSIYHSDWYRVQSLEELLDAGIEEYLYRNGHLFLIEWPGVGLPLLEPAETVAVSIEHGEGVRTYRIQAPDK